MRALPFLLFWTGVDVCSRICFRYSARSADRRASENRLSSRWTWNDVDRLAEEVKGDRWTCSIRKAQVDVEKPSTMGT